MTQPQHVPDLVRRHRLQVHRLRRGLLAQVHRPPLRRVQVQLPPLRREGVRQHPQLPVERLPVAVVAAVEPHPHVRRPVVRRLHEAHRDHLRPPRERAPKRRRHVSAADVVDGVRRRQGVGQRQWILAGPTRLAGEEGEPLGQTGSVRRRRGDRVRDAAAGGHQLGEGGGVELAGDGEAEISLVQKDGRLEPGVEGVGVQLGPIRLGQITEPDQVQLEAGESADVASALQVQEVAEGTPRVVRGDGFEEGSLPVVLELVVEGSRRRREGKVE